MSEGESHVIAGIFDDETAAATAVHELMEAGFDPFHDISVIAAHHREHEEVTTPLTIGATTGAEVGIALGAVLGAASALVATAVTGPVGIMAVGPIVAALEGAYAGGATGYLTGALTGLGFWKQEADFHAAHIHGGAVWVGVHAGADRYQLAHDVLAKAGARHFQNQ